MNNDAFYDARAACIFSTAGLTLQSETTRLYRERAAVGLFHSFHQPATVHLPATFQACVH